MQLGGRAVFLLLLAWALLPDAITPDVAMRGIAVGVANGTPWVDRARLSMSDCRIRFSRRFSDSAFVVVQGKYLDCRRSARSSCAVLLKFVSIPSTSNWALPLPTVTTMEWTCSNSMPSAFTAWIPITMYFAWNCLMKTTFSSTLRGRKAGEFDSL